MGRKKRINPICDRNCKECPYPDCELPGKTPNTDWEMYALECADLSTKHRPGRHFQAKDGPNKITNGQRIIDAREAKGLTAKRLGQLVGRSPTTIHNYEAGASPYDPNLFNGILW